MVDVRTAEVEDTAKWEEGFRTHGDLFRSQTITTMVFGIGEGNEVALCSEVENLETWRAAVSASLSWAMSASGTTASAPSKR